ncbi:hypothetical protein BpHYR1_042395 [Brachionus plicatilis]|uniref:Uncharacterized protein n=1 Tax=Brachionus plicatilis TaxID=10195 RepID=A0A3M7PTH7_BRAPC|nr:hypothetical protein BpHYR1_042395 [Brachionus plicatilis]
MICISKEVDFLAESLWSNLNYIARIGCSLLCVAATRSPKVDVDRFDGWEEKN